jgi:hypothetical protein
MSGIRTTGYLRTLQVALTHPDRLPHRVRNQVLAKTIYHPVLVEQARVMRRLWR